MFCVVAITTAASTHAQQQPTQIDKAAIARAVDEYLAANPPTPAPFPWQDALNKLQLFGDIRLRHESTLVPEQKDRHRQRLRLRLGIGYLLSDELTLGARIITGDRSDPKSPHVTLGDGFEDLEVNLDRAFVTYRPSFAPGATLTAGKFDHPFARNPVYGELLWDADIQPEGIVGSYRLPGWSLFENTSVTAGVYPLSEQSSGSDSTVFVGELSTGLQLGEQLSAKVSGGYYYYDNINPRGTSALFDLNLGNAVADRDGDGNPDSFASDFGIFDINASMTYAGFGLPLAFAAEYITNTRANIGKDQGWAVGVSYGRSQSKGDWRGYYQWQVIEQDALASPISQDDFAFATNFRGHVFGTNYQFSDAAGLHLWGLVASPDSAATSDDDVWRMRIDFNVKF